MAKFTQLRICLTLCNSLLKCHKPVPLLNKVAACSHRTINSNILNSSSKRLISTGHLFSCSIKEKPSPSEEQHIENSTENVPDETALEKELSEKIKILSTEVEDFKDKYQRSLADRENLRLRMEKQVSDSKLFGIQSFCKDLLEVSDVLRKAIESVPPSSRKSDPVFVSFYDGVSMTEKQLLSVFRRHGLERIIPKEGDKFDPSVQEAVFEAPQVEGQAPGTVAHVVRTGWTLHRRCVRSAQVGVVKE